jgi:stringent starvation protein B
MTPPGKKETLLAYLGRGIAMLHLDARRTGVLVPAQHADDPHLRLNLSYRYGIPDLVIDDRRVQATLSFRGQPFRCQLPWSAIFGITSQVSGEGQVWPEDLPSEVMTALARHEEDGAEAKAEEKAKAEERAGEKADEPPPAAVAGRASSRRRRAPPERARPTLVAIDGAGPEAQGTPAAGEPEAAAAQTGEGAEAAARKSEQSDAAAVRAEAPAKAAPPEAAPTASGGEPPAPPDGAPRRGHLRLVR